MMCKVCGVNPAHPKYYGMCSSCRTKKYAYSKGKKCVDCGSLISNWRTRCDPCMRKTRKVRVTRECIECHKQYKTIPSNKLYYCSPKCRYASQVHSMRREGNPFWKDGPTITKLGYVEVWDERRGERIREHTQKAEKALGRRLKRGEAVHHINMVKSDNRNCNLVICSHSYHRWLHREEGELLIKSHPELFPDTKEDSTEN